MAVTNPYGAPSKSGAFHPPPAAGAEQCYVSKPAGATPDRELVRRAQGEDKEAFEELGPASQHRVFAVAGGILRRRPRTWKTSAAAGFVKAYFR